MLFDDIKKLNRKEIVGTVLGESGADLGILIENNDTRLLPITSKYVVTAEELEWTSLSIDSEGEVSVSNTDEFTYVMEDKVNTCYKIGKTKNNPVLRLNQLKTANPHIVLVCAFSSLRYSESDLHKRFAMYKKDLEWFFATSELKQFVADEIELAKNCINYYKLKAELESMKHKLFQTQ
jgi:T5orf172 domain